MKRPTHTGMVKTVSAAEHWRRQVIREFNEKLSMIQNASLGEHKIRDLNDDLNKLLKEKYAWEMRIIELNGPDYRKRGQLYDEEGNAITLGKYIYFGAAKNLDGVRDMLKHVEQRKKEQEQFSVSLKRLVLPPNYYYYHMDDDDVKEEEEQAEKKVHEEMMQRSTQMNEPFISQHWQQLPSSSYSIAENIQLLNDYSPLCNEEEWKVHCMERRRQLLQEKSDH
jgi:pre-mRNA-splicing factor ISY1